MKGLKVLDCSSSRVFTIALEEALDTSIVVRSDLLPGGHIQNDLTACAFSDDSFDVVICSHILEHIPQYRAALAEIHRILRKNGRAILQTPVNPNLPKTIEFDRPRLDLFGHVREFGGDFYEDVFGTGFEIAPDASSFVNALDKKDIERFGLVFEIGQPFMAFVKV